MLPEALLCVSIRDGVVVPHFLGEHDHPWLRVLLDEHARFVDRPRRELDARLREPLPCESPPGKLRLAMHVLSRNWPHRRPAGIPPRHARAAVFGAAARSEADVATILSRVAGTLGVTPDVLKEALFADLPGERVLAALPEPMSPGELALRVNLALAQGLLFRSAAVRIELAGNARVVVRQAKLRGLICTVAAGGAAGVPKLEISGPYSLFRRTLLYGRALAELLPLLAWCHRFRLRAHCILREQALALRLESGAPIFPAAEPRRYDSAVEERFARDFCRIAPDWDVVREPEPVSAGDTLIFPDFALQHRGDGRRWLLEIVGFWTPEYVRRKLADLRAARLSNLILCIDEARSCADGELPPSARVVRFRRRVDATVVLRAIEGR